MIYDRYEATEIEDPRGCALGICHIQREDF